MKSGLATCHELVNREKNGPELVTADNFALFCASRPIRNGIIATMKQIRVLVAEDTTKEFEDVRSYLESMKTEGFQFDIVRTSRRGQTPPGL